MTLKDKIKNLLQNILDILKLVNENNWSPVIDDFILKIENLSKDEEMDSLLRKITRIYAGMGSFSDLVLYRDGKVCELENENLDNLRKELHTLCVMMIEKQRTGSDA